MLGPIGANLMSILKVLTPSEIDMYSELQEDKIVQPVAVGAEDIQYESGSSHLKEEYQAQLAKEKGQEEQLEATEEKAKIIPINKKAKEELDRIDEEMSSNSQKEQHDENPRHKAQGQSQVSSHDDDNELNTIGIYSSQQMRDHQRQLQEQEAKKKESTSVFILNQRAALKNSRSKMIEQKAIQQYQKNSATDMLTKEVTEEDLADDAEMRDSNSKGILLNKRHF